MEISGRADIGGTGSKPIWIGGTSGAFSSDRTGNTMTRSENAGGRPYGLKLTASAGWTGSTSNNSSVNSVYGKYTNGIRPNSLSVKVKTRYY